GFLETGTSRVLHRGGMQHELMGALQPCGEICKSKPDGLMRDDWCRETLALAGVLHRRIASGACQSHTLIRNAEAPGPTTRECDGVARAYRAELQVIFDENAVEPKGTSIGCHLAQLVLDSFDAVARAVGAHQKS